MKKENSTVIVDLGRVKNNLTVLDKHLPRGVKMMAVVKADAYGHGSVGVAKAVQDQVSWFAVNELTEGIELREAGIKRPVLVFEPPRPGMADLYPRHRLTATVSSLSDFEVLSPGTEYHLNIDTGMGRLGFLPEQVPEIKARMGMQNGLRCTGIYSHFATSDEPGSAFAENQLIVFKQVRSEFSPDIITHMCNTGGCVFYPAAHFDMVRTGIGMYGYSPGLTEISGLLPVLTWQTRLAQVKHVKRGAPVSYGSVWRAPEDGFIGVLPVGYDDGIRRKLTGRLRVRIGNRLYPVVGTITMNYCMVFLGKKVPDDAGVVLFDGQELTASTWAEHLQTIPYEILTGISDRIPRIYC